MVKIGMTAKEIFDREQERRIAELEAKLSITKAGNNALARLAEKQTKKIKEINHRVKNDFAVVSGMLGLQAGQAKSDEVKKALQSAQNRVMTMARVYEQLQQSGDGQVNMAMFVMDILDIYQGVNENVKIVFDIPADMTLPVETAVPCAKIINELVSNSFKHAFPDGIEGGVKVAMEVVKRKMSLGLDIIDIAEDDEIELIVSDNGIGLPKDLDIRNTESLGMQIVSSLSEQLESTIDINRIRGTWLAITFKV